MAAMKARQRFSQQTIVFVIFVLMFAGFSIGLPGFLNTPNMLGLLQNVAILGILGLGMAIIVIGRGIDISMVAVLAVPSGLILQMVQDGHALPTAFLAALGLALAFGLANGWLIAYAEVPSLFTRWPRACSSPGSGRWRSSASTSCSGARSSTPSPGSAAAPWPASRCRWSCSASSRCWCRSSCATRLGMYVYAIGDNPFGARTTGIPTRPVIVLQYVLAALIGAFAGMVMAASVNSMPTRIYNSTMIYDVILVVVLGGIGLSGGRGGVVNVVIGTLLIGTLLNGMTILDVSYSAQNLIKGVVLLAAILIDSFVNPRNEETAQQGDI